MATDPLRVIIVGGGRVGYRAGRLLDGYGHEVVVIEKDPSRCEEIADQLPTVIEADATLPPVLREADPGASDVIAALTEDGATNLAVCLAAQRMNESIYMVLRTDTESRHEYGELVDGVVYPEAAGARLIANEIVGNAPRVFNAVTGDIEIVRVEVGADAPLAGETLADATLPDGCLVITDADASNVAGAETVLEPDCQYIVAVDPDDFDAVVELLSGTVRTVGGGP
ncbi:potassium channel family protein [Natronococcus occultus]|uniref:K+ transport system, NAD-binding component n=1 Tax=Natronococcus occultus SP4 TaxID=694430 RepID=L0JVC6_9EURY|nr:TrkA family potassium uptake protein [Natronococcus occultus]AGB36240.1 K+ transport system, NAD-binding component [Natronococcus occultus SP4]